MTAAGAGETNIKSPVIEARQAIVGIPSFAGFKKAPP
jgi:hypothetical protein